MLKVLFVSSGNSKEGISHIVKNQGESLRCAGLDVDYFTIVGKGLKGYLKNVIPLRRHIKKNKYDIIHAHYSLSAFAATLARCKSLVVSLMGSDIRLGFFIRSVIKLFSLFFWEATILKSQDMLGNIGIKKGEIIPNGVNTYLFKPIDKKSVRENLGWNGKKKHMLFASNCSRAVKNFPLMQKAYEMLRTTESVELYILENIPHQDIPKYMNASDVVILTSLWEGSSNVIKEAMACNCPIVSTDVGDVRWIFGDTPGCYITSFDPADVAQKLKLALEFSKKHGRTQGRKRIIELSLDSETIANRIIRVYELVLERNEQ